MVRGERAAGGVVGCDDGAVGLEDECDVGPSGCGGGGVGCGAEAYEVEQRLGEELAVVRDESGVVGLLGEAAVAAVERFGVGIEEGAKFGGIGAVVVGVDVGAVEGGAEAKPVAGGVSGFGSVWVERCCDRGEFACPDGEGEVPGEFDEFGRISASASRLRGLVTRVRVWQWSKLSWPLLNAVVAAG